MTVTKKQIQKALSEAVFTPSKDSMMQIIMDGGNYDYYIKRAIEMLKELSCPSIIINKDINQLNMILRLIALAKLENE